MSNLPDTLPAVGTIYQQLNGSFLIKTDTTWLECAGQEMGVGENPQLFSILGFQYGRVSDSIFLLPNLANEKVKMHSIDCEMVVKSDEILPSSYPDGNWTSQQVHDGR